MICIHSSPTGVLSGVVPGPDGCPGDAYVALSPVEFDHYMVSPFKLSMGDAGLISSAVVLLWAVGFGFRVLIRVLRESDSDGVDTTN